MEQATPTNKPAAVVAQEIAPKRARHWRARVFQIYILVATSAFGGLFILASRVNYFAADLIISRWVQRVQVPWLDSLMWGISYIGYAPQEFVLMGGVIAALAALGLRWEAVAATLAGPGGSAMGTLFKVAAQRPRPGADLVRVVRELPDASFPSGHVLMYTAFFGFLFFLVYTLLKPSLWRSGLLAVLGILIGLVGASRVYIGAHWPSDVTGAYLWGSVWLSFSVSFYQWGKPRFFVRQPLAPEKPQPDTDTRKPS